MTDYTELAGTTLGAFELAELLFAEASIIATYKAYQPSLNRYVAIQILNPDLLENPLYRDGFKQSATIIGGLEHAHIAPVHDFGVQDDFAYIVTRLMAGKTLRKRLNDGKVTLVDLVTIVNQIGSALDFVHEQNLTHGDPSLANIVFDESGNAYIGDFHVAGFIQQAYQMGQLGVITMGTEKFMAPERLSDGVATPATDQYALARIVQFLLENMKGQIEKSQYRVMAPVRKFDENLPPLARVLARALAREPEDRYATVADFARAFESVMEQSPKHIFISYSRRDKEYIEQLRAHLQHNGFEVWMDNAIEHGAQWFNEINSAIETCAAVLVVMSPEAEHSEWVQKEVLLAKRYEKPIFPLLLAGQEFPILIDIQYENVSGKTMPRSDFYRRLRRVIYGQA